MFRLANTWEEMYSLEHRKRPNHSIQDDIASLAKSLRINPTKFNNEFTPLYEHFRSLKEFSSREDDMIMAFAKDDKNKDTAGTFVFTKAFHEKFYPNMVYADVVATVDELKLTYTSEELLERRARVCEEEDKKMKKLAVEWKLKDGTPDYKRIAKEFPDLEGGFVKRKIDPLAAFLARARYSSAPSTTTTSTLPSSAADQPPVPSPDPSSQSEPVQSAPEIPVTMTTPIPPSDSLTQTPIPTESSSLPELSSTEVSTSEPTNVLKNSTEAPIVVTHDQPPILSTPAPAPQQPNQSEETQSQKKRTKPHESHFLALAKAWGKMFWQINKTNPTNKDLTNLAKSLHRDPEEFINEFNPVLDFALDSMRNFTPNEDQLILAFANLANKSNRKINFEDLTDALNRSEKQLQARYDLLVKGGKKGDKERKEPPKKFTGGVPMKFETRDDEEKFLNNMARAMLDNGFVFSKAMHECFYPQANVQDITATVLEMKGRYSQKELLAVRERVCGEEDKKMKELMVKWKRTNGNPDTNRIAKEFPDLNKWIVDRKIRFFMRHGNKEEGEKINSE
ncbi:hypothetical protein HDU76_007231 [Blyttiomyces sp. JEL0837]|nr:hypothetical protein HDU76_007231 [Blyttiomyces sp. JEL0837]